MARILYGVAGEGMGHALRSKAIIDHLLKEKHEIVIIASQRAYHFLDDNYENVHDIHGLHIHYEDNEVKNIATLLQNTKKLPAGTIKSIKEINEVIKKFNPEICICDFEPYTNYISSLLRIPCIEIDNICVLTRTKINYDPKFKKEAIITKTVIKLIAPRADVFFLTTFFYPKVKYKNTQLFSPIIREKILNAKSLIEKSTNKHILVYQTSKSNYHLIEILKKIKENFIIYGFDENKIDENLIFKKFSLDGFVSDLVNSKAIITNGGYSLISEAIYLKKPILSEPVRKQFEQIVNATYIQRDGYGLFTEKISEEDILKFLKNIDKYKSNLEKIKHDDNKKLFGKIDYTIPRLITKYKDFRLFPKHILGKKGIL